MGAQKLEQHQKHTCHKLVALGEPYIINFLNCDLHMVFTACFLRSNWRCQWKIAVVPQQRSSALATTAQPACWRGRSGWLRVRFSALEKVVDGDLTDDSPPGSTLRSNLHFMRPCYQNVQGKMWQKWERTMPKLFFVCKLFFYKNYYSNFRISLPPFFLKKGPSNYYFCK